MTIITGTGRTSGGEMTDKRRESVLISVSKEWVQAQGVEVVEKTCEQDARWWLSAKKGYAVVVDFEVLHGDDAVSEWVRTHPEDAPLNGEDHHMLYQAEVR